MEQDTKKESKREKLLIIIMISSVYIGIYLALNSWLTMKNNEWNTRKKEQYILQTEKLATDSDKNYFITRKILPLLKLICEDSEIDIKSTRENLLSKYNLDITIYKFDKGKLIDTAPENASNKWLMRNLYPALVEKDLKKIELKRKELDKKIEFVFGYGKNLFSLQNNPERIIDTVISGKESFSAWSCRGDKGVIILSNGSADKNKILKEAIRLLKPLPNQISSGKIEDINLPQPSIPNSQPYNNFVIASRRRGNPVIDSQLSALQAYNYLSQFSKEHGTFDNKEWYFTKTSKNEKYYTVYNCVNSIYYTCIIFLRIFIIFLALCSIIIISNNSTKSILNLKKFVTLIFIASSILPLTLTASTTLESIETLTNIYRNELSSSIEESIGNIVQKFGNHLIKASDDLKELTTPSEEGLKDIDSIRKMADKITERFPGARVTARNAVSEVIYSNIASFSEGQESLFKSVSNRYIEKYIPERLRESEYKGNQFADIVVRKDDLPFAVVCNYPEQLQYIKNSDFPIFLFIKVYNASIGEIALLEVHPLINNLMKEYTKHINIRNLVSKQQTIKLAAYSPIYFKWYLPPNQYTDYLFEQAKAAYVLNKPIFRRIRLKNEEVYSLCVPNSNYEDICFIGYLSTNLFRDKIIRIKKSLMIGAIIAIIMLICIISWLMKQIIGPLSNLEIGIKALSEHKFETKIPVPKGKDELATLFKEFNFMMGENYDMQIAKNVQEGLITTKFPDIQNYYINGFSVPIDNLAGDCLTTYTLPDGKILFLVGDLTGHGIGSALMMTFVRSITFNWSQNSTESILTLVKSIDQMLRDNQMEHMFMGIVCGILDAESRIIKFTTRGHIYPLFLRNDDTCEWLGTPALPLGIGKKQESIELSTVLLPGERLLCFTDGLLATNNHNAEITFQQIEIWARECIDNDNSKWLKSIETKYLDWCSKNNAIPIDDITLFTIINLR